MTIISIIDDNTSILTSLSLQFQSKGYKTITFADPEKALLYHEDKPADAYVIDMKMPKLTGFEFYRDLCAVLNKDKLPALFLTAVDNLEERALKDTTIGDFVLKPFSFNILHARLEKVMSYFAKQKADQVYRLGNLDLIEEGIEWVLANIACKSSLRAYDRISLLEMNALLRQIETTTNSGYCSHGRPTWRFMSVAELDKIFMRGK